MESRGGGRTHDQAAYRDHNLLGKLLDDVIELGFGLCDLSVSEGSLHMKEQQVGVLCPKIGSLMATFGTYLVGVSFWSFKMLGCIT